MKNFLKLNKPVHEALDASPIKDLFDEIKEKIESEKAPGGKPAEEEEEVAETAETTAMASAASVSAQPKTADHQQQMQQWVQHAERTIKECIRLHSQVPRSNPSQARSDLDNFQRSCHLLVSASLTVVRIILKLTGTSLKGNSTESQLADVLKNSGVGKVKVNVARNEHIMVLYDIKACGESVTAPHDRVPPFRSSHLSKMIGSVCKARESPDEIPASDVWLIPDAFRHGNTLEILKTFKREDNGKTMDKHVRQWFIFYDQEALSTHRGLSRGSTQIHQMEFIQVVSSAPLDVGEDVPRLHYKGSNKGDAIGPVKMPDDCWKLTFQEKKTLYGPHRPEG